jgi:hypothetical protein
MRPVELPEVRVGPPQALQILVRVRSQVNATLMARLLLGRRVSDHFLPGGNSMRHFTLTAALFTVACGAETTSTPEPTAPAGAATDDLVVVPAGKADNFYSDVAAEFEITGTLPVVFTAEELADEALRGAAVQRRLTAFGLYLTAYVTDKFRGIDKNGDGIISDDEVFFRNEGYGGFQTMVRNYSLETLEVSGDETMGHQVRFTIDVAGPRDLRSSLGEAFEVQMPKGKTVDVSSVPRGEIRNFDPKTYMGELETVPCTLERLPDPANAFPAYDEFTVDGLYDLTLFYGHDYNTARSDLREARAAFDLLEDQGFAAPVETFEALTATSGAFVKDITANGQPVRVEVRIFHSEMFTTDRRGQHDLALSEIVSRDVFFYNGHAGPYFGFYLDEARQATVNYAEFESAPFTEKQQLVVAQGCQTYSQYADMLYANPAKSELNLDVITTVNYSYGHGTERLLEGLIRADGAGRHTPVDFYTLVGQLNDEWLNDYKGVFYGVMGIDGNAQLHPYANLAKLGEVCETAADCGDTAGNVCVATSIGPKQCGARALGDAACPPDTRFEQLARGNTIATGACLKR